MSGLFDAYMPKTVANMTFASSALAKVARALAVGARYDNLLLHGAPGTGKTALARLIVSSRYPTLDLDWITVEASNWTNATLTGIESRRNFDRGMYDVSLDFTIINEVDELKPADLRKLKSYMDCTKDMKFILTTNHPNVFSASMLNRLSVHKVDMMPASDVALIVQKTVAASGYYVAPEDALTLVRNCCGSWRTLEQLVYQILP